MHIDMILVASGWGSLVAIRIAIKGGRGWLLVHECLVGEVEFITMRNKGQLYT